ncbi:OLC1v1019763C2 [Oldenlandia corymbosa var. corymbosa]|uniref:OLC1v1019763C2 n=1 Tax=Oldenlandia corymbosa var. corymbosa TaxID=529605 RepID=A0AAV1EEW0_OLDCO|nr:OLC1v1019763C2 [Oldenlandia corymbosa var. corymbosa]
MITAANNIKVDDAESTQHYDRRRELKEFDDSKCGVKGLVDAQAEKIPRIFVHPQVNLTPSNCNNERTQLNVPIISFGGISESPEKSRAEFICKLRDACQNWGFFQVLNHGIPVPLMDEMIEGVRRFHEQDVEIKKQYYSRDVSKRFYFNSNFDLYQSPTPTWRDTMYCIVAPDPPKPEDLPAVCRDILLEYSDCVTKFVVILLELLSEALGLNPSYLKDIGCDEGLFLLGHYYPACPEPELTLGTNSHTDSGFLTVLIQDQIEGLQVLHQNQWVDVPPVRGALIVNIADLLQASFLNKL